MNKDKNILPIKKTIESRNNHHLLQFKNQFINNNKKQTPLHALSEVKPRSNVIKINKAKLPPDFFPKCWSFQKKLPHFKLSINQHQKQFNINKPHRVQSERLHISPQKTSFFGFFQQDQYPSRNIQSKTLAIKRKFETRQEPKRDNSQMKRRFTPGSNLHRNQLLQLFPTTYDQQITQIITSNSSARMSKLSPRKQYHSKYQQLVYDPEKEQSILFSPIKNNNLYDITGNSLYDTKGNNLYDTKGNNYNDIAGNNIGGHSSQSSMSKNLINLKTIQKSQQCFGLNSLNNNGNSTNRIKDEFTYINSQTVDLHNMTFFNAKSSCLPPIKKI